MLMYGLGLNQSYTSVNILKWQYHAIVMILYIVSHLFGYVRSNKQQTQLYMLVFSTCSEMLSHNSKSLHL